MRKPREIASHYPWVAAFVGSESMVKTISLFFTLVRNKITNGIGAVPAHVLLPQASLGRTSYACLHSPLDDAFALVHELLMDDLKETWTNPTHSRADPAPPSESGGTAKSPVFDWNQLLDMKSVLASNSRTI